MMMMKIKMMEANLWVALCALLLVNLGSAEVTNGTSVEPTDLSKHESSTTLLPSVSPVYSNLTTEGPEIGTNITNVTDTSSIPTPTPQPSSNQSDILANFTSPSTPSNQSTQNERSSSTSVPTPEPTTTATTAGLFSNSTSNTSSFQETSTSPPSTTSQSSFGSTKAYPSTTTSLLNSTSTHAESPSQLNIAGDDAHNSPAVDPLLAGLVSAFIITAVIITLLLFLRFRRRESGPQFQRLQNLPMDDIMEDTPLSMFTY